MQTLPSSDLFTQYLSTATMPLKLSLEAQELARKASLQGLTGRTKPTWDDDSRSQELYVYNVAPKHLALYEKVKEDLVRIVQSYSRCGALTDEAAQVQETVPQDEDTPAHTGTRET